MEYVEGDGGMIEGSDAMDDPAGDSPHIAGSEESREASHGELELTLEQVAHLFVGMGMVGDHRPRLEADDRQHHALAGGRSDLDAGEDDVLRSRPGGDEIIVRVGDRFLGVVNPAGCRSLDVSVTRGDPVLGEGQELLAIAVVDIFE